MTCRAMRGRPWTEELYAALKLVRSEIDILKQQEAVQKKIFEHYKVGGSLRTTSGTAIGA